MSRLILAFVLLLFSFNAASASGLLSCCDMSKEQKTEAKAENTPKPCHETADAGDQKETSKTADHCLCASMCAAKITSLLDIPPFNAVSFDLPASYGVNDIAVSVDRRPESPPPKI